MSRDPGDEWYVRTRGKVLGPFPLRQLEVLRNQGRLAKFDEVSRGDRRSWVIASTLPELFPSETITEWVKEDQDPPVDDSIPVAGPPAKPAKAVWHYMGAQGASAPVDLTELSRLAATGGITPETLVWTADMTDWAPARTVPVLGLSSPPARPVVTVVESPTTTSEAVGPLRSGGGTGFSVAGLVLGLLSLFSGIVAYIVLIPSAFVSAMRAGSARLVGLIFFGILIIWAVSGLLAVILGSIGLVKATRDEKRRGFGLGISALVLGMLALTGLVILGLLFMLGSLSLGD